ncbi:MAG: DciA family protein [Gemmatimonadota bacterium]
MSRRDPRPVGQELDRVLRRLGVAEVVESHAVFGEWADRVGAEIARAARPHRIDGGTLIVLVRDSSWMTELSLRQRELLARLNAGREHSKVERILFRLDPDPDAGESRQV